MDWSKGYTAEYYMTKVDPATWRDVERVEITGGSIKRQADGLMESATVDAVNYPLDYVEQYIRLWMDVEQDGSKEHVALFTGLATSPDQGWTGSMHEDGIDCYSVLKALDNDDLMLGWYAARGRIAGDIIKELLAATPAPCTVEDGSPRLEDYIVAESGESKLTMLQKILTAIDWRLRIEGDGTINVAPPSTEPVAVFDPISFDVIETEIEVKTDLFDCPNVYMVVKDGSVAIAKDEAMDSPISTAVRGREVWQTETGVSLADNETLAGYAARKLKEAQRAQLIASYSRRYVPTVRPDDVITMHYPVQGLNGNFTIESQSIELGYSARTEETITKCLQ